MLLFYTPSLYDKGHGRIILVDYYNSTKGEWEERPCVQV
jgi:hypothetical protein